MKQVEAIVRTSKLDEVRASLGRAGVDGMTVVDVRGFSRTRPTQPVNAGGDDAPTRRLKVEIVVEDGRAPALVEELLRALRTGRLGDGKIFVLQIDEAVRIRTSERGRDAL